MPSKVTKGILDSFFLIKPCLSWTWKWLCVVSVLFCHTVCSLAVYSDMLGGGLNERFCFHFICFSKGFKINLHVRPIYTGVLGLLGFGVHANDKLMTWGKSKLFVNIRHHASNNRKWGFVPFGASHQQVNSRVSISFPASFKPLKTTLCCSYSSQCTRQSCCLCVNRTLPWLAGGLPEVTAATGIGWPTLLSICSAG